MRFLVSGKTRYAETGGLFLLPGRACLEMFSLHRPKTGEEKFSRSRRLENEAGPVCVLGNKGRFRVQIKPRQEPS